MNNITITINNIGKKPLQAGLLGVFTFFIFAGVGFGVTNVVAPQVANALVQGPGCCDGGIPPFIDDPGVGITDPGYPGFGGGGGGGGGTIPNPICEAFEANPSSITAGETVTLTWDTTYTTSATINNGIGSVSVDGTREVSPTSNTTYVLTATGYNGTQVFCDTTVVVEPPVDTNPICEAFSASPNSITRGESSTLSWSTQFGTGVSISGIGAVATSGTQPVSPTNTTTYTLTVTDADGDTDTCQATVTVEVPNDVPVCTLTADKYELAPGEFTTIRWTIDNATEAYLQHLDAISLIAPEDGSQSTQATGTYTLSVAGADGDTDVCEITITRKVVDPLPVCTLTADKYELAPGEETTIRWTIDNANTASLQHLDAISLIAPVDGSQVTQALGTYTLRIGDGKGNTDTCVIEITRKVVDPLPVCTLTADKYVLAAGEETTIRWTIDNATEAYLQHLDAISIITPADGSQVTQALGTYTLSVTDGKGNTDTCEIELTRLSVNAPQCVAFTADPNSNVNPGSDVTLTWDTENATSVSINNGIGAVAVDGNTVVNPTDDTTYTLTVEGNGQTVTCEAAVDVDSGGTGGDNPQCDLFEADPSQIKEGQSTTLRWETTRATKVEINNGIGEVDLDGDFEVSPDSDTTYTLTATRGSEVDTCTTEVDIDGGGGGGGRKNPRVSIDVLPPAPEGNFAVVTLSQIPYTGLELGPMGTIFYWTALILWSGALAYLVLFKLFPLIARRPVAASIDEPKEEVTRPSYRPEGGFASLKREDDISVDDIVRGLSSQSSPQYENVDEEYVEEVSAPLPAAAPRGISTDAAMFLNTIMAGDRTAAFGMLRRAGHTGGQEQLMESALVLLDEAYRARIDGTECDADVARICAVADTALLEQVIDALATAVDTSYSKAQTGAKMALTRALSIVQKA